MKSPYSTNGKVTAPTRCGGKTAGHRLTSIAVLIILAQCCTVPATLMPPANAAEATAIETTGKPIPAGPGAFTDRDLKAARLKWYRKITIEAYQKVGIHSPAWDADALRLLEKYVLVFAAQRDMPLAAELLVAVAPLMKSGCNDPLILYCVASALWVNGQAETGEAYLRRAVDGYEHSKYPRAAAWPAPYHLAERCWGLGGDRAKETPKWLALAVRWLAQALAEGNFDGSDQRVMLETIRAALCGELPLGLKDVRDAVAAQSGADPWVANMIEADYRIAAAWSARGSDWAYTVTEEGWKRFGAELQVARECLTRAWSLHPAFPEAPTQMLQVVAGGGERPGETLRQWFDRAVAGQMDYMPAYDNMLRYLLPRWGGSHEAMYGLGQECLATKRFDTNVPEFLAPVVWTIAELDGMSQFWRQPGVYDNLRQLYQGLLAEPSRKDDGSAIRAMWAAMAWRCAAYDDARQVLDALGMDIPRVYREPSVFESRFQVTRERALGEVYAATGPDGANVRRAETLYQAGQAADALPVFEHALTSESQPRAQAYLRDRITRSRTETAVSEGEWAAFVPGSELDGWRVINGQWNVEGDGALAASGFAAYGNVVCDARVGADVEITGEIELQPGAPLAAGGVILRYKRIANPECMYVMLYGDGSLRLLPGAGNKEERLHVEVKQKNTVTVQVLEQRLTVTVNGRAVIQDRELRPDAFASVPTQAGLVAYLQSSGGKPVRFCGMKIRRAARTLPASPA